MKRFRIGNFSVERRIGSGAMADVWLAQNLHDERPVAVKTLRYSSDHASHNLEARFAAEVQAIARLSHPGIVAIYDHGITTNLAEIGSLGMVTAGSPWLAMEYCKEGDLRQHDLKDWAAFHGVATALLEALALTHACGILHRDLKPANILVAHAGADTLHLKIADFGLVQSRDSDSNLTRAGLTVGTPNYMAPEQAMQLRHRFGPGTDLYALGALLWQLAAGRPPFAHHRDHLPDLLRAQVSEQRPPLPPAFAVPHSLEAWLRRLLEKHPQQRFLIAAAALAASMRGA